MGMEEVGKGRATGPGRGDGARVSEWNGGLVRPGGAGGVPRRGSGSGDALSHSSALR